ncbi:hypothetical protein [Streptomyces violarus]|uniref:hypothetical protein n=1 Tax=Streptomyces violarus TaxID=67380 RepID=UPI0021BDF80C|nr:hypothetical protein [Streptomyces violarus]MCT9145560.1 hypothetical protein [Streptomyces violarus]
MYGRHRHLAIEENQSKQDHGQDLLLPWALALFVALSMVSGEKGRDWFSARGPASGVTTS